MSQAAKVIELVGTSSTGWQDAAEAAIREASKTVHNISGVEVTNMTAQVKGDHITEWRATVKIAFGIERERTT